MIIATAGHVDHGKTTLVRALTGVDTDRLAEERARGMSIDLGFAYADFGGALPTGFVDVPGHARFLRNMLAGVAAIDHALIVVAADDGPMPQTREHLAILSLLGVSAATVALTKVDRVTDARRSQARAEIGAALVGTPLEDAALFEVATPAGLGVDALRAHLGAAERAWSAQPVNGNFRLAVDRAFTLDGAGLVVTGAVFSGDCGIGDALQVSPSGVEVRVRAIHAQGRPAERARAGQRCALNLAGPGLRDAPPGRGDWILAPQAHAPTDRLDVTLRVLADEPRPLAGGARLQLHLGSGVVGARVVPLAARSLAPGQDGLAQLVTDQPVAALRGDRFVVRDVSSGRPLGGGMILDPFGPVRGRASAARLDQLAAMGRQDAASALQALLGVSPEGITPERFVTAWNLRPDESEALTAQVPMRRFTSSGVSAAVSPERWDALAANLQAALAGHHTREPEALGVSESELLVGIGERLPAPAARAVLAGLIAAHAVIRDGQALRRADHQPRLDAQDTALLAAVVPILERAGLRAPIVGELAQALGTTREALLERMARLARLGHLVRIAPNRFFLPATVEALAEVARQLAVDSAGQGFDAAAYRDRSGIGRNLTIEVLEFLDRSGVTRFARGRRWIARR